MVTWASDTLYDIELRLGCCDTCGLSIVSKLLSHHNTDEHSSWDLKFFLRPDSDSALTPPTHILRFKFYHGNGDIVGRRVPYGKKRVCLVSRSPPPLIPGEMCPDHLVLLQWANSVSAVLLTRRENSTMALSRQPLFSLTVPCREVDFALYESGGLNSELVLSSDSSLLGLIFQARLHVWEAREGREVSRVQLPVHEPSAQLKLLALGHLITVVGLQFSTDLLLVMTRTGRVIKKYKGFAQQYTHMVPPYIELLCVNEEEWLSDIAMETQHRSVTFWNKTNRSLEAIVLGEGPVANGNRSLDHSQKPKPWWKFWK